MPSASPGMNYRRECGASCLGGCPLGPAIASHSTSHGSFTSCEEDEVWVPGMGQDLGDIKERLELCRDGEVLIQALGRNLLGRRAEDW